MLRRIISFRHFSAMVIVLCGFIMAAAQTKDAVQPRTGSISGHILIDNKAAADIQVAALNLEGLNRRSPVMQTKTDSEGYYHLAGLPPASYQIATFTPNMVAAEKGTQSPYNSPFFATSQNVLLAAGEDVNDIDLKLVRGGVVTGRITDADDKPIAEERVSIQFVSENGQPAPRIPSQFGPTPMTDDRGVYRIYGLPPGRYRVSVGQEASGAIGSPSGFYVLTYYPDATDLTRASLIDVIAGAEVSNIDIKLKRRAETRSISGRVVDAENGLPLSGVRLGLQVFHEPGRPYSTGTSATTTADGSFTIAGVTSGKYAVYIGTDDGGSDFYSDPVKVNVGEEDVSGVQINALRGTSISGTVIPENMELKELLTQVPGLRVTAHTWAGGDGAGVPTFYSAGESIVRSDGSFTIPGMRPGRASLSLLARDPLKQPTIIKVTAGGVGVPQGLEITREPLSGVELVVAYGTGVISGTVEVQGGSLSDYRAEVVCSRQVGRTYPTGSGAYPDARGHFTIKGVAPGTYECRMALGFTAPPSQGRTVPRPPQFPPQTITVTNGTETQIRFAIDLTPKGVGP
ncbi:MAG TPA: carboxypeptidase regulatory-like domain-containing protein [Pyrinomonadaceae bacterium]|nr:carboxypeptidase regulatory-like domain-containing protein [Pyrinomonadaceae bacterium]